MLHNDTNDPVEQLRRDLRAHSSRESARRQQTAELRRRRLRAARAGVFVFVRTVGRAVVRGAKLIGRSTASIVLASARTASILGRQVRLFLAASARRWRTRPRAADGLTSPPAPPADTPSSRDLELEELDRRQLWHREVSLGPDHPDVALLGQIVAQRHSVRGNRLEALVLYERAFAINERIFGPDHPEVAAIAAEIAGVYRDIGDLALAVWWESRAARTKKAIDVRDTGQ